jgi:hypothetical protein
MIIVTTILFATTVVLAGILGFIIYAKYVEIRFYPTPFSAPCKRGKCRAGRKRKRMRMIKRLFPGNR